MDSDLIPSFQVNHLILPPGIYVSRVDRVSKTGVTLYTFDLRFTRSNRVFLDNEMLHSIEHCAATAMRQLIDGNPKYKGITPVYFGPMGCQTGFYMILGFPTQVDSKAEIMQSRVSVVERVMKTAMVYEKVPGSGNPRNCGNYKTLSADMNPVREVIDSWLKCVSRREKAFSLHWEYPTE